MGQPVARRRVVYLVRPIPLRHDLPERGTDGREDDMRRRKLVVLGAIASVAIVTGGIYAVAAGGGSTPSKQAFAQRILNGPGSRFMTTPARTALEMFATGSSNLGSPSPLQGSIDAEPTSPVKSVATMHRAASPAVPDNVRVNDPSADHFQPDQTTQSETTIAVAGQHVAVGYNDSQQSLIALTAATNLTGYSYSNDGGASFHDGGDIPNALGQNNFGDPWMTSTPDGTMYYSTLSLDQLQGLLVGVARSTDGGHTWSQPVNVTKDLGPAGFQLDDKPALTAGKTPSNQSVLYDTWDDFACDAHTCWTGLPVSRSLDGGQTWHVTWASRSSAFGEGCSFSQFIGAQPLINPANGTLFVAAERIAAFDPDCVGKPITFSEVLFTSHDGGLTFTRSTISNVTPAFDFGAMKLGPGMYMRTIEFPSLALHAGTLAVTWNDGRLTGHSHILLATRSLGGGPWNLRFVTQGTGDEVQPAITADGSGFHVAYYARTGSTLDVQEATSSDIANWTVRTITSRPFPGVFTVPQFDPIIAFAYMGDYIANVNVDGTGYFAWGDDRDVVTNFLWPDGRHDPDVFFASG
jgi:hypothetical protein